LDPSQASQPGTATAQPAGEASSAPTPPGRFSRLVRRLPARLGPVPLDRRSAIVAASFAAVALLVAWAGTGYVYEPLAGQPPEPVAGAPEGARALKSAISRERTRERQLRSRLDAAAPRGVFVVIDQTHNRLYLKRDDEVLLQAVCSAGSGMVLKESGGKKREWVFDTPRGRFEVISMAQKPVWKKPDWAFVEEGEPIPKNPADRLEYGTLGEYALYFGNGYMIHGTLYERLLGRAVSHGCIRVGRDDLRKVWANARLGMPIFIY